MTVVQHGPRIPSGRELAIVCAAVFYVLLWTVCTVMAVHNLTGPHPLPPKVTTMTCPGCEPVPYQEEP